MLHAKLQYLIEFGRLTIIGPSGRATTFGADPDASAGPDAAVRAVGLLAPIKLAPHPGSHFGEAYASREGGEPWLLSPNC